MNNNNSLAKREPLEVSIADCDRIEDEFTRKAVLYSNFFTDNSLKAEAAKQVISRLDHLNRIKLVYDDGKKEETKPEIVKKPSRVKRAVITAVMTTALMGAAYFGALVHFGKQDYEAQVQELTADKRFVLMQKQNAERNSLEQQGHITRLQENYANSLETIAKVQGSYSRSLEEKARLQGAYLGEQKGHQETRASLQEQLARKEQEYSRLEQAASGLREGNDQLQKSNSALVNRIIELRQEQEKASAELSRLRGYDLEIEHFIEEQIIQRAKKHGDYSHKGPFADFVGSYSEFFFGREPNGQQKQVIDNILRKYVKTDGRNVDDVIRSWSCGTIILQYRNNRLQIIDP